MPQADDSGASAPQSKRRLRVLQIVSMLHSGGVERWVVDLCPAGAAENLSMDIMVMHNIDGLFARRARERGINVFHCPGAGQPWTFFSNFRRLLRERGPYDAIHCQIHAFSSFAVLAARMEGIPARVVHSHNVVKNSSQTLQRRGYIQLARPLIRMFATAGLAPSSDSAADLFGPSWKSDSRWRVMPCGIDLAPFRLPIPAECSRASLGIPDDALVMGSVGRLTPEKNSEFLVDVLAAVLRRRSNSYLLLVGEGELRERLEQKARAGGYAEQLLLPGARTDVPFLMRAVVDVFVFPSPPPPRGNEALPLAVVEAQAADLPTVISDGVTTEAIIVPELVMQVPADAGAEKWADAVIAQADRRTPELRGRGLKAMERSLFNVEVNMRALAALYRNSTSGAN